MLTDEERIEIRNRCKHNNGVIDTLAFAQDIERAVLAKAIPILKQEPVGLIRMASHQLRRAGSIMVRDGIEQVEAAKCLDLALKLESVPAQAAAIPWIPIDTAPKDGSVIMVCGGTYGCAVDPWPVEDMPLDVVALVYWRGDSFMTGNDDDYDHYNPRYWMPVPAPKPDGKSTV